MRAFYYAQTDENRVLCVDQLHESGHDEVTARQLAVAYPRVIYFIVDNRVPEFRVPVSGNAHPTESEVTP
jgi:hypothetical protein